MFCTGDAPTVPGIRARISNPGIPCASVQVTKSCQFWPAAASMIQALGPAASTRSPMISILSTTGLTSPVRTMLVPPPSTSFGNGASSASAATACKSATERTRTRAWARAAMPKVFQGCKETLFSTTIGPIVALGRLRHAPCFPRPRATMPSFDTVCEANLVDVRNAVENTAKEIATRFDFKGTAASITIQEREITLIGDADFQLTQIEDVLRNKLTKRSVDVRFLDMGEGRKIGGDKVKQLLKVRSGIESELARKIQKPLKDSKLKVQGGIQEDRVRVTGAKRDDLQAAMALIRKEVTDVPLSFDNFRDLAGAASSSPPPSIDHDRATDIAPAANRPARLGGPVRRALAAALGGPCPVGPPGRHARQQSLAGGGCQPAACRGRGGAIPGGESDRDHQGRGDRRNPGRAQHPAAGCAGERRRAQRQRQAHHADRRQPWPFREQRHHQWAGDAVHDRYRSLHRRRRAHGRRPDGAEIQKRPADAHEHRQWHRPGLVDEARLGAHR